MADPGTNQHETGQNGLAVTRKVAADTRQAAVAWSADGSAELAHGPAELPGRRHRRDGLRSDARRTTEYLASRGKTPVEALHDVAGMGWRKAVRLLGKELGVSRERAYELWRDANKELLPFTAHRLEPLDAGAGAGAAGAAGGLAVMHFLAAKAAGDRILAARDGATGRGAITEIVDRPVTQGKTDDSQGVTRENSRAAVTVLPPRRAD
jgi:hypothetical protein